MKSNTLYLDGFSNRLFGRQGEAEVRGLREKARKLDGLAAVVARFIPSDLFAKSAGHDVPIFRLSFKGTVGVLHAYAPLFSPAAKNAAQRYEDLLLALAAAPVPIRPNRSEPRVKKRRPKSYQLLTRPRREMRVSESRRRKLTMTPLN